MHAYGIIKTLVLMLTTTIVYFSPAMCVGWPGKSVSPTWVFFFPLVFGQNIKELMLDVLDDICVLLQAQN